MVLVLLMVMTVDMLLLCAAARLLGSRVNPLGLLAGSLVSVLFAWLSLLPGFRFLEHFLWRLCAFMLTGFLTFGFSRSVLPKLLLFVVLRFSLGGVTNSTNELTSMLLGAAGISFACAAVGIRRDLIPVKLCYQDKTVRITALRDTGNTLTDPITGEAVLVVGADIAEKLTGLTPAALDDPVKTMGAVPGLRLIPYETVGNHGFLLALRIPNVRIGRRKGSMLVAFAPRELGSKYQALTGGMV